jgi:hypothetical protein
MPLLTCVEDTVAAERIRLHPNGAASSDMRFCSEHQRRYRVKGSAHDTLPLPSRETCEHEIFVPIEPVAIVCGPYRSGKSRQGAPARSTQKIPLRTRRLFLGFTPRRFFGLASPREIVRLVNHSLFANVRRRRCSDHLAMRTMTTVAARPPIRVSASI